MTTTTTTAPLKLALLGHGRMGRMVEAIATERGHAVVARCNSRLPEAPLPAETSVAIDFSRAEAVFANLDRAASARCNLVLGTTGWDRVPEARERLHATVAASGIGVIVAPNFSFAAHLFKRIVEAAARLADGDDQLDAWIEEAHHRGKADHPSGTALALAKAVLAGFSRKTEILTQLPAGAVPPQALHVAAARGGWEPGLHRVVFDAPEECITLEHRARSRRAFALGAVRAAEWVRGRTGVFTLDDLLSPGDEP